MAQPQEYHRTKDFTVDFQNETDHSALNAEFDGAANSINQIRSNLMLIQADDGALRPQAVTRDTLSDDLVEELIADVDRRSFIEDLGYVPASEEELQAVDDAKQEKLNFDNTPTEGSFAVVYSNGIKAALNQKVDIDTADNAKVIATGSTEKRVLADRFADVINVRDFGAKGDGETDDTQAIQAALNAQASTGAKIFVPAGKYICGSLTYKARLSIYGENVSFESGSNVGDDASVIVFSGQSGILFSPDSNVNPRGSSIEGITFQGSAGTAFKGRIDGGNRNISIVDCCFSGFDVAVHLSDAFNNSFYGCYFSTCGYGIKYESITFASTSSVTGDIVENCYFSGCTIAGVTGGGFNNIAFINDIFEYNENGITATDSYRTTLINCYFEGNVTSGATLTRGIAINCFTHGSLGVNTINFTSGCKFDTVSFYMFSSGVSTLTVENSSSPNNVKLLRPYSIGRLRLGTSSSNANAFLEAQNNTSMFIGVNEESLMALTASNLRPYNDNTLNLGAASYRWKEVFAATATINTSDERLKDNISGISDAVLDAWGDVNLIVFQFKDAIDKKGENARIHTGVIAQQVQQAFEARGLDAFRYGLLCYDEWDDEFEDIEIIDKEVVLDNEGNEIEPAVTHIEQRKVQEAGDRYSIRYEEALVLEAAYQRREVSRLKERLSALEERI